jgi:mono/diheme cytochrome c family protein
MQLDDAPHRLGNSSLILSRTALLAGGLLAALGIAGGPALAQEKSAQGEHIFMDSHCFVCHGQLGTGGVGPAFRADRFLAFTDYVAGQILMGRGVMPPFADSLTDQQIAAVAGYIRTSWGNNFGEVKPEQVAQVRKQIESETAATGSSVPPRPAPADSSRK